jgi:hypothetical protein
MAVGGYATSGNSPNQPFAENLSGTTWSPQPIATPANGSLATLTGVSCTAASSCIAVGNYYDSLANQSEPFAASWNGTSWTLQTVPLPAGTAATALYSVTCTSASACIATGGYDTAPANSPTQVLVETWDGTNWTVGAAPTPAGATAAALTSISCTAATACTAVGGYATSGIFPNKTLAERWDGTNWTIQSTPSPAGSTVLSSVSCTGAECFAVGSPVQRVALVEVWNGATWSVQTAPKPSGSYYSGVSCTSTTACTLVGGRTFGFNTPPVSLAEGWNGTNWALQKTANLGGAASTSLMGVSCTATLSCEAVGTYWANGGHQDSLAEAWNGTTWAIQVTPVPAGANGVVLNGVSCTSSTACEAVGQTSGGAFAEQLSGTTWSDQTPPNPASSSGASLSNVSCTSATSCIAVGGYSDDTTGHRLPLIEQLSGTTWSLMTAASPAGMTYGSLSAVTCTSSSACIAVGSYSTTVNAFSGNQMLVEVWDGANWTLQTPPSPTGSTAATLSGVSCSDASDCTAVGGYTTTVGSSPNKTLAERWNGTAWAVQTTPNPTSFSVFTTDSCASATACTALGTIFAEGWDGTVWSKQTLRNPSTGSGQPTGVSCTAATTCTASGMINTFYFMAPIFANSTFGGQSSLPLAERYS